MTDPYSNYSTPKKGVVCADCLHCKQEIVVVRNHKTQDYHLKRKVFCKREHPLWLQKNGELKYRSLHTIALFTVDSCYAYVSMLEPGETMEEYLETLPSSKEDAQMEVA